MNSRIQHNTIRILFTYVVFCILGVSLISILANAVPEGAVFGSFTNSTKSAVLGTAREDARGTINYVDISGTTQNQRWKAYVGNVTGTLVLQDAGGFNLYDWVLSGSMTGNILASRNNTLNWNSLDCADKNTTYLNESGLQGESRVLEFSSGTVDNINNTFNSSNHTQFTISVTNLNGCPTVYTFQNNTRQTYNSSANVFQEIAIVDNFSRVAYATKIYDDIYNYRLNSSDFQLLLPDFGNLSNLNTVTYYFFVELI